MWRWRPTQGSLVGDLLDAQRKKPGQRLLIRLSFEA